MKVPTGFGRAGLARGGAAILLLSAFALSGCNLAGGPKADINNDTKFSQVEYEVKASPRVTEKKKVRKGGGRYQVGKPYKIRGKWYTPEEDLDYVAEGQASWYGPNFHGRLTANGEIYDQYALSAAHPTMPLPSYARVTNLENGRSVMVRVNDRGPFAHNRIIDLSARAADMLGYRNSGVADVQVEYVGKARMDGNDQRFLMASYRAPTGEGVVPGASQSGTMLAMNAPEPSENVIQDAENFLLAAAIPVPTQRPGLYAGGVPLDVAGQESFQIASVQPLGYRSEAHDGDNQRVQRAFDALMGNQASVPDQASETKDLASQVVHIRVGEFADLEETRSIRGELADLGMMSIRPSDDRDGYELRLMVGGDATGAVLLALRARGHTNAIKLR